MTNRICIICGEEFNPKHPNKLLKGGLITVCGDCVGSEDEIVKHIAFIDTHNKTDYRTEIIRNPTPGQISMCKVQGRCGPGMCHSSLGLSSNGANTPKDKIDKVHATLYADVKESI